jgi:D-alanine-D-alanine ligase
MKKTVAVIFGGQSAEAEVSIITAHIPIIQSLQASGEFDVCPVYIAGDGSWYSDGAFSALTFFQQPDWQQAVEKMKKVQLLFDGGLAIVWPGLKNRTQKIDVAFPAMHGTYGEDGSLMGLLRMAGVPFVGCDIFASAVAMDKVLTKQVLASDGVSIVPYVWFTKDDWSTNKVELTAKIKALHWPVFVKPVHLGSSIGISKAKNDAELENAIEVALHYDDKVLVEEAVENLIEVTLPIMGNSQPVAACVERPMNKTELFDFSDKYLSGGKSGEGANAQYSELPANIGDGLTAQVKSLGIQTYKVLGCAGISRVDFLIDSVTGKVYVNEVNTLPGSLYHHNWRKAGVSSVELVTRLIALAEERFSAQKSLVHVFNSDILTKVSGPKVGG